MHKTPTLKPTAYAKRQQGFSLIEISLSFILVVGIIVSIYQILDYRARMEQAKTVADHMKSVHEAVSTYAGNLSHILSEKDDSKLPFSCENNFLGVVADDKADANSVTVAAPVAKCSRVLGNVSVRNVMQPTMDELRQLNYLSSALSFTPPFITDNRVVYNVSPGNNAFLPPGYAVQIKRVCVNNPGAFDQSDNYCKTPSPGYYDLQTLVFSSQPFRDKAIKNNSLTNVLQTALRAAGADALLAADGINEITNTSGINIYPLVPANANGQTFLPNPLKVAGDVGLKNILAMRGGYGSSVKDNSLRRDGLITMTGDLKLGFNSLSQVNQINTSAVTASGDIKGFNFVASNNVTARSINIEDKLVVKGEMRGLDRIYTGNCSIMGIQHSMKPGDVSACNDVVANNQVKGFEAVRVGADDVTGVTIFKDGRITGNSINFNATKDLSNINGIKHTGLLENEAGIKSKGIIETTKDFITTATQKVQAGYMKFLSTVKETDTCGSEDFNSITIDSKDKYKLLRCDELTQTWMSMLQKGADGKDGTNGKDGAPSLPGAPGLPGTGGNFVEFIKVTAFTDPNTINASYTKIIDTKYKCADYIAIITESVYTVSAYTECDKDSGTIHLNVYSEVILPAYATWAILKKY